MADLAVELHGTRIGVLSGTWREFDFIPDPAAVAPFGIDSPVLSVAIPLTAVAVRSRKAAPPAPIRPTPALRGLAGGFVGRWCRSACHEPPPCEG